MRHFASSLAVSISALGLVGLLVFGVLQTRSSDSIDQAVAAGERPVAFAEPVQTLNGGREESLADFKGRIVVLNFFASWCGPCDSEAPALERVHRQIASSGGTVIGVAVDDVREQALSFVRKHGLSFPVWRDVDRAFAHEYELTGIPETFVIDRRGRIVALARHETTAEWIITALRRIR